MDRRTDRYRDAWTHSKGAEEVVEKDGEGWCRGRCLVGGEGGLVLVSLAIESLFVQTPPVTVTGERSEQDDPNAVTPQVFSFNRQLKGRESYGRNNERSGEHKSLKFYSRADL